MQASNLVKIIDYQETIIRLQSETINELFQLLMQHVSAEELDRLPCVDRINKAARLQEEIT